MFTFLCILFHLYHCAHGACVSKADCSYLGRCVLEECICNRGWYGIHCEQLNLTSSIHYPDDGYHDDSGLFTWDGSPIFDAVEQRFHVFITILTEHCHTNNWLSNSVIAHIISDHDDPLGPYTFSDIALGYSNDTATINTQWDALSVYTPIVLQDDHFEQTGIYYLFYVGTTMHDAVHPNCTDSPPSPTNASLRDHQAIGYATSKSLYGPWIRNEKNPVITARSSNDKLWDSAYVCNPFPVYLSNGSIAVIYKGIRRYDEKSDFEMNTGIALIDHNKLKTNGSPWDGPYIRFDSYFNDPGNCEDGFFWEQVDGDGLSSYHMEYHCGCNAVHAHSIDLMHWTYGKQQPWCNVTLSNGTVLPLERRERPAILFESKRQVNASYIFTAVYPLQGPSFNLVQQL